MCRIKENELIHSVTKSFVVHLIFVVRKIYFKKLVHKRIVFELP